MKKRVNVSYSLTFYFFKNTFNNKNIYGLVGGSLTMYFFNMAS